jgi:hypothetical protein
MGRVEVSVKEPMVKGAIIRNFLAWYEERFGVERVRELARRAPADLRSLLDPEQPIVTLLASSWYPCRLVHSMLDTAAEGMSESAVLDLAREANREAVARELYGVYRFVVERLVTPEIYAVMVPRYWRQLHSTGARKMRILKPGEAESTVAHWPGHHPLLCLCAIETMRALFERMGKKDVAWERTSCVSEGGSECVTRLTWK